MNEKPLGGKMPLAGEVKLLRERQLGDLKAEITKPTWGWRVKNFFQHQHRSVRQQAGVKLMGRVTGLLPMQSALALAKYTPDLSRLDLVQWQQLQLLLAKNLPVHELAAAFGGRVLDFGTVSRRVVTTAGVNFLVDSLQGIVEPEILRYHGFGTGGTAEAVGDTALVTELTTQYNPDNTRPTGSQTEGAANVFRTVGTLSPDSGGTIAITEHGIFSQAATGGGTLLDRSLFAAVNVVAGSDSLQATYDLTLTAGS